MRVLSETRNKLCKVLNTDIYILKCVNDVIVTQFRCSDVFSKSKAKNFEKSCFASISYLVLAKILNLQKLLHY